MSWKESAITRNHGWSTANLLNEPAWWEYDKIRDGCAGVIALGGENGEYGGIGMVEAYAAYRIESSKIILVGIVQAVPSDDVEWSVVLLGGEQVASKLGQKGPLRVSIFVEGGYRGLEIADIRKTVRSDGSQFRKLEVALVQLENVAPDWPVLKVNAISNSSRNDTDLVGADK